jgi:hypothetical protein
VGACFIRQNTYRKTIFCLFSDNLESEGTSDIITFDKCHEHLKNVTIHSAMNRNYNCFLWKKKQLNNILCNLLA